MEIAYVLSDAPVICVQLTVYGKYEENLPKMYMIIVTDFIVPEAVCQKLQRFKELGAGDLGGRPAVSA